MRDSLRRSKIEKITGPEFRNERHILHQNPISIANFHQNDETSYTSVIIIIYSL